MRNSSDPDQRMRRARPAHGEQLGARSRFRAALQRVDQGGKSGRRKPLGTGAQAVERDPRDFGGRDLIAAVTDAVCEKPSTAPDRSCPAKGAYTYTPTPQARHDAAAGGPTTDTFTVTIDDGHGGVVDVDVQVPISPKNATPADPVLQLRAPDGIGTITFGVR